MRVTPRRIWLMLLVLLALGLTTRLASAQSKSKVIRTENGTYQVISGEVPAQPAVPVQPNPNPDAKPGDAKPGEPNKPADPNAPKEGEKK